MSQHHISQDPLTAYFQLKDSNDHTTPVNALTATVEFSDTPPLVFASNPNDQFNFQIPHATTFASGGCTEELISSLPEPPPPAPGGTMPAGETWSHVLPNAINVQAASAQCFPISIANSLQYLEARYGLTVPNDHTQGLKGDDTLVGVLDQSSGRPVTNRRNGGGTPHRAMMTAKLGYIYDNALDDRLVMKHMGRGFGSQPVLPGDVSVGEPPVTSTDEGATVTWMWVCDQIKAGEDVELTYNWPGGGHAVRVFGCGKTNGRPWIKYLHDRDQTDDTEGLETVEVYMEDIDGDGNPNFGSAANEVRFAWSESVTPAVKTSPTAPPQTVGDAIVNAASFLDQQLTGGAIGTVFGVFRTLASSPLTDEIGQQQTLPNALNGVQVLINGIAAPLFFAGDGQVNFLVPSEIEPGIASMVVMVNGVPSDIVSFPVSESAPAMFMLPDNVAGPGRAVIQNQDFSINVPNNPAPAGAVVILYLTGTGPTTPPIPTGELAPSTLPLAVLDLETTVTIGGVPATVHFAGGAPGFAGLTQINVTVPALDAGDHEVIVTVGGVASPGLFVAVGP